MTQLIDVEAERRDQMLMDAADRNTQVVLSYRPDGVWMTYKSHMLQADSAGRFLILSQPLHGLPIRSCLAGHFQGIQGLVSQNRKNIQFHAAQQNPGRLESGSDFFELLPRVLHHDETPFHIMI